MDVYVRLQRLLDQHPSGAPASESFDKILRLLFSPEEAKIACSLTFALQSLHEILPKIGMEKNDLKDILDEMAERGCIMGVRISGHYYYALLPTLPGFYEFPFMRKESNPNSQELAGLWQQYLREGFSNAVSGSPTPQMRVIPIEKTIPNSTEVLHYEMVTDLINTARLIAVTNCTCKEIMNACSNPREVCMAFDNSARYILDKGWAREVSQEEALNIIRETEAAGMVHCVRNSQEKLTILCNCCSCCCMLLRGINEFENPNSIATSSFIVKLAADECTGCMLCTDNRCPTYAIKSREAIIEIETKKCIGCGLCVTICPSGALTMESRIVLPHVPIDEENLLTILCKEKGK